jgi:predicted MFS family arabinose efflux permease
MVADMGEREMHQPNARLAQAFVIVLTVATVISFVHRYLPSVLVDSIRGDMAITDVQFSTLQTAFALTYAAATLGSGWIADRTNRRNLIVAGVSLWTGGTILFGLANELSHFWTARIMIGLGEAVLGPAGISLICDYVSPRQRGKAIALTFFGATLGTSLAFSGGGWLLDRAEAGLFVDLPVLADLSPWRQVVLTLGGLGLILIPSLLAFKEPQRSFDPKTASKGRLSDLWRLRSLFWLTLFTGSSVAVADFAYTTWQTSLLTRSHGLSAGEAGQLLGLSAFIAGTAGAWVGGFLSDRAHDKAGLAGRIGLVQLCALGLLGSAALLAFPLAWAAIAAFALWQVAANIAYVAVAVTLQDLVTDRTRALAASMSVCLSIGLGLGFGPTTVALLNQSGVGEGGLSASLLIVLGVMGLITLSCATLLRRGLKGRQASHTS